MGGSQSIDLDTRSAVLREAAALFAAQGYDAVSVREIVAAAGVTKPALYYYFGSKEGVAKAVVDEFMLACNALRHGVFKSVTEIPDLFETYSREMLKLAHDFRNTLSFGFSIMFGRSSLKDLVLVAEDYHVQVINEWQQQLTARGMKPAIALAAIKTFWALLQQELMRVVQCPDFKGCGGGLAHEIATIVLHGVAGLETDTTGTDA